jgi:hypothetical protein
VVADKNSSIKVRSIPVADIKQGVEYLSLKFYKDTSAKHELHCFLKEVCSKNAYPINDLIIIVRNSKESFSSTLFSYLEALSQKQLRDSILESILEKAHDGYSSYIRYHKNWKVFSCNDSTKYDRSSLTYKIFARLDFLQKNFYYYDDNFVNLHTTPDIDLPLYINYEWPCEEDGKLYRVRMDQLTMSNKCFSKPSLKGV